MKQLNLYWLGGGGGSSVPDGRTVTPVNDVTLLQQCAGISNPTYTSLSQILADTGILQTILSSENAVNYLVRSTDFIKSKALVPKLSGNDSHIYIPNGQGEYSGEEAWRAFDENSSTRYSAASSMATAYIGYGFDNPVSIGNVKVKPVNNTACNWKVQYSDDASIWTDGNTYTSSAVDEFSILGDNAKHKYCRVECTFTGATQYAVVAELQFYSEEGFCESEDAMRYIGRNNYAANTLLDDSEWCEAICNSTYFERVLNFKNPDMTDDNTPSGYIASASMASADAFKAFGSGSVTTWNSGNSDFRTTPITLDIEFPSSVRIYKWYGRFSTARGSSSAGATSRIQYLTNGSFTDIPNTVRSYSTVEDYQTFIFNVESNKFRMTAKSNQSVEGFMGRDIKFYGRKDV